MIERYSEKLVPLEHFSRHLLERIKSLESGRDGSVVWKISGFNNIFDAAKRSEVKVVKLFKTRLKTRGKKHV